MSLAFIGVGFGKGYRKGRLFGIIFLPYRGGGGGGGGSRLMSCNIVNYLTFLSGKI